jgi:2-iminobutanoate/2-iminopropanoate deaminase
MKLKSINAATAPGTSGAYSQAVEVTGASRWLFVSGQIPVTTSASTPADFSAQARLVWANLLAQLEAADMSRINLVKVTTFLSAREFAVQNSEIRREILGDHAPALTVIISDIYDPEWLLEIEAVAVA